MNHLPPASKVFNIFFVCFIALTTVARLAKQLQIVTHVRTAPAEWGDVIDRKARGDVGVAIHTAPFLTGQNRLYVGRCKFPLGAALACATVYFDSARFSRVVPVPFSQVLGDAVVVVLSIGAIFRRLFILCSRAVLAAILGNALLIPLTVFMAVLAHVLGSMLLVGSGPFAIALSALGAVCFAGLSVKFAGTGFAPGEKPVLAGAIPAIFRKGFGSTALRAGLVSGHSSSPFMTVRSEVKRGKMVTENHRFGDQPSPRELYHKLASTPVLEVTI